MIIMIVGVIFLILVVAVVLGAREDEKKNKKD